MKKGVEFWIGKNGICLLEGWARNGWSDYRIARKMRISVKELMELKMKHCAIEMALGRSGEVVDLEVEKALLNKALAGDVRACVYWLKNRMGGVWNDKGNRKTNDAIERSRDDVDVEVEGLLRVAKGGRKIEE